MVWRNNSGIWVKEQLVYVVKTIPERKAIRGCVFCGGEDKKSKLVVLFGRFFHASCVKSCLKGCFHSQGLSSISQVCFFRWNDSKFIARENEISEEEAFDKEGRVVKRVKNLVVEEKPLVVV